MHDQRNRHQRKQLIEKIHGKQICRKGNPQRHAIGYGIKQKEYIFMLLFCHILKGIQGCQRPQRGNQTCEYHPHPVHLKADGQIPRKISQSEYIFRPVQQQIPYQEAIHDHHCLQKNLSVTPLLEWNQKTQSACDHRKQDH